MASTQYGSNLIVSVLDNRCCIRRNNQRLFRVLENEDIQMLDRYKDANILMYPLSPHWTGLITEWVTIFQNLFLTPWGVIVAHWCSIMPRLTFRILIGVSVKFNLTEWFTLHSIHRKKVSAWGAIYCIFCFIHVEVSPDRLPPAGIRTATSIGDVRLLKPSDNSHYMRSPEPEQK